MQVGHDEQGDRESHAARPGRAHPPRREDRLEQVVQGCLGQGAEAHGAHGDAQLGGREHRPEPPDRLDARGRALASCVGERLQGRAANGHGSELGADEERVAEEQDQRHDVDPGTTHRGTSVTVSRSGPGGSGAESGSGTKRNRSTRRRAMPVTWMRQPGTTITSPTTGTRPSRAIT